MNQIFIGQSAQFINSPQTFNIHFDEAEKYLQILRADHFAKVTISLPENIQQKQLRFTMSLSRILKEKGEIHILNSTETNEYKTFVNLVTKLGLHQNRNQQNQSFFSKQKIQNQNNIQSLEVKKTSIGFKPIETEEIDEEDLMKNENINLQKPKTQNCAQKPRACANCNCSRKNNQQPLVPKQKLIESINDGKPVSGCGKCFLGDSFRCGTCPYKGLPAFKPGDKLKLMQEGQVVVQTNQVKVESGKVKIQL